MAPARPLVALALVALLLSGGSARAEGDLHRFEVLWGENRSEVAAPGEATLGESRTVRVNVTQENLTGVDFFLTWEESGDELRMTGDDTFRMTVFDPASAIVADGAVTGSSGLLRVTAANLSAIPASTAVEARDHDDAARQVAAHGSLEGVGTWRVQVELLDTRNPPSAKVDESNRYTLTVVMRFYEAGIFRVVSLQGPQAKVQGLAGVDEPVWVWSSLGLTGAAALLGAFIIADRAGWLRRRG